MEGKRERKNTAYGDRENRARIGNFNIILYLSYKNVTFIIKRPKQYENVSNEASSTTF